MEIPREIRIPEGMERQKQRFLDKLEKEDKVILYHDIDPDGIVAGALLKKLLENMGIDTEAFGKDREEVSFEEGNTYLLADIRIDRVIAEDARKTGVRLYYVDHHEPTELPRNTVHFNPWLMKDVNFPVKPYSYNTALLAWILEDLPEGEDWKVAAAHWADHAVDVHTKEWMEEMREKYGKETIERVANFISLALTFPEEVSFDEMRELVRRARKPEDILENRRLKSLWRIYEEELNEWLEKVRNLARKEKIVYIVIEGVRSRKLRGSVSTIVSDEFPDRIFIIGQREGDFIEYSLRFQNYEKYSVHLGKLAEEAGEIFGGRGGGHPPAAGLKIRREKEKEFKEWVKKKLRSFLG